jgi:amino acid permease
MVDYYVFIGKKYWFTTQIPYLDALIPIVVGIILFCIFYYLHSKKKLKMKKYMQILLPLIVMVVLFVALMLIFPIFTPQK